MAIRIFSSVDDFLGGGKSKEEAAESLAQVKGDLECSGFIVCPEKLTGTQFKKVNILVTLQTSSQV